MADSAHTDTDTKRHVHKRITAGGNQVGGAKINNLNVHISESELFPILSLIHHHRNHIHFGNYIKMQLVDLKKTDESYTFQDEEKTLSSPKSIRAKK